MSITLLTIKVIFNLVIRFWWSLANLIKMPRIRNHCDLTTMVIVTMVTFPNNQSSRFWWSLKGEFKMQEVGGEETEGQVSIYMAIIMMKVWMWWKYESMNVVNVWRRQKARCLFILSSSSSGWPLSDLLFHQDNDNFNHSDHHFYYPDHHFRWYVCATGWPSVSSLSSRSALTPSPGKMRTDMTRSQYKGKYLCKGVTKNLTL